jgi:hypothetical protein
MAQDPAAVAAAVLQAPSSEKVAASDTERIAISPAAIGTPSSVAPQKLRSCTVCRSRRVRCDKQSPCSNCRRAGIACVFPSADRPPRWARRFERSMPANNTSRPTDQAPQSADLGGTNAVETIRNLQKVINDLRGELALMQAAARSGGVGSSAVDASETPSRHLDSQYRESQHQGKLPPATDVNSAQKQFGRLVLQDTNRSRYVSSEFWSEVNDEVS